MDTHKVIEEQIEILSNLSRRIVSGDLPSDYGDNYYLVLPDIGSAIAALCAAAKESDAHDN